MSETNDNANRKFERWIEYVLLAVGITLLLFWGYARAESIIGSRAALGKFEEINSRTSVSAHWTRKQVLASPALENAFSPEGRKKAQVLHANSNAESDTPLAVLWIPKIRLEAPVLEGTDPRTLNHAVGRIAGTARLGEDGNIGLAGHRDGFFRGLRDVSLGDTIELRSPTGTVTYEVDLVNVVAPQDVSVLNSRFGPSLTLVTCYPFSFVGAAPLRYIVSASAAQAPEQGVRLASIKSHQFTRRNND